MVEAAGSRWQLGQATVEHVGLALVIALLFGALGTWAVREFRPPASPPPVIERVAAPLFGGGAGDGAAAGPGSGAGGGAAGAPRGASGSVAAASAPVSPVAGMRGMARAMERAAGSMTGAAAMSMEGAEPAKAAGAAGDAPGDGGPGVLRRAWDGFLWWGALNVDGQIEAGKGFLEQIGVRAEDLVKDPVKTVEGAIDRLSKPPVTSTADRVANIVRTLSGVGDRPFRESFLDISRDLGGLGADWLIAKFARGAGEVLGKLLGG